MSKRGLGAVPGSQSTSSSIGSDILARVRALLNEATSKFWDDNDIYQWITDAVVDVTANTHCTGATETVPLVDGTLEYAVSASYIDIVAAIYNDAKALLKGHPSMLGHVKDPDEVVYYYEFDGNVGFIPKPGSTDDTLDVVLYYLPLPGDIVAATAIPVPKWLDQSVVLYATALGLFEDNEMATGMQVLREYENSLKQFTVNTGHSKPQEANDPRGK